MIFFFFENEVEYLKKATKSWEAKSLLPSQEWEEHPKKSKERNTKI